MRKVTFYSFFPPEFKERPAKVSCTRTQRKITLEIPVRPVLHNFFPEKSHEQPAKVGTLGFGVAREVENRQSTLIRLDQLGNANEPELMEWKIKKVLKRSDVGDLCRLVVGKTDVETNILSFWEEPTRRMVTGGQGARVLIKDVDTGSKHSLVLKRWNSSNTYIIQSNWKREFVERRSLREGDEIRMSWDQISSSLCFSVLNRA